MIDDRVASTKNGLENAKRLFIRLRCLRVLTFSLTEQTTRGH